jgi:hypothetical protein
MKSERGQRPTRRPALVIGAGGPAGRAMDRTTGVELALEVEPRHRGYGSTAHPAPA